MAQVMDHGGSGTHPEMALSHRKRSRPTSQATRRVGYVAAAVVNGGMLWVANHLLGWGWPPFLTSSFEDLRLTRAAGHHLETHTHQSGSDGG